MTRDQGPPEDGAPEGEQRLQDGAARRPEQAETERGPPRGLASVDLSPRRRALGTQSEAQDDFTPSESWLDAFSKQYSREVMEHVCRYAARLLSGPIAVSASDYLAQELAQDAVDGTLEDRETWDPARRKLKRHLFNVVKRKIAANRERERRLQHVSIDVDDPDQQSQLHDEMEHAMRAHQPDPRAEEHARIRREELRRRATGDPDVVALLDAIVQGHTVRADIMAATGLSPQRYRAALRRLNRLVRELGIDLYGRPLGKPRTGKTRP